MKFRYSLSKTFGLCLCLLLFGALSVSNLAATREPVRAENAIVAAQHELASKIGADVMKKGGNAVDAAIATAFALAVVYPEAGNLGGGGFMLIHLADGRNTAIDYRETAPIAASRNVYVNQNNELIKGEGSSTVGYRAAGIPGTVAGLRMAFEKYGSKKMTWAQLVEPARELASNGYVLSFRLAELFKTYQKNLAKYDDSNRIFLNNGKFYREGDKLIQKDLAQTLLRIEKNPRDFYDGETARLIVADIKAHNGLITLADLQKYQPKERAPLIGTYRGNKIVTMPPPSSGGAILLQVLNVLEGYDVRQMGWASSEKYHVLIEAMRRAFADRSEWMGDADFVDVPLEKLISKEYAAQRRATIDLTKASLSADIKAGELSSRREPTETTHFTVADANGNVVSNTYTINDLYGSAVTAKGTGVLLNDEMDDFAAQPGQANMFGLIQGERNAVAPNKRPLSSMTPTIVLHPDGKVWFAVGARGGPRIITAVLQTVINAIDHEMNIQAAIDQPRLHQQWLPDEIIFEPYGLSVDTRRALEKLGHKFAAKPAFVASATGIMINETGVKFGAVDSRSDGAAVGY